MYIYINPNEIKLWIHLTDYASQIRTKQKILILSQDGNDIVMTNQPNKRKWNYQEFSSELYLHLYSMSF